MENLNKRIVAALRTFGLPVAETLYEGTAKEYFYYNITLDAVADSGDNLPQAYAASVQIHYVCPWTKSYAEMLRQVERALRAADFCGMNFVDRSEAADRIRHWVVECETEDGYMMED